jgi:hypothetical protein
VGDQRVQPEACRQAEREASEDAHQHGHESGDEGRGGRHHADGGADVRTTHLTRGGVDQRQSGHQVAELVGSGADDERVQGDDVGHREERHEATTHLRRDGRMASRHAEPSVDGAVMGPLGGRERCDPRGL